MRKGNSLGHRVPRLNSLNGPVQQQPKKYTEEEMGDLHHELQTRDHIIPIEELCEKLGTHIDNGLTTEDAARVYAANGPNSLSPPAVTPEYIKFLKCMFSGFASLLWICAFFCFVIYATEIVTDHEGEGIEWFGLIIIIICVFSGIFAYIQESKNSKIMDSFKDLAPTLAMAIRNGKKIVLPVEEVVVGDVIEIRLGDKIPADVRIIECRSLRVENSSLTGSTDNYFINIHM